MKFSALMFLLFVSTKLMATSAEWLYQGHGKFRNPLGELTDYSVSTRKIKDEDNSYIITKKVTSQGETYSYSYKLLKSDLGLLEVKNMENETIGSGYYFKDFDRKMMHIEYISEEGKTEKTVVTDLNGYKEIGSCTDTENQHKASWIEYGERVSPL